MHPSTMLMVARERQRDLFRAAAAAQLARDDAYERRPERQTRKRPDGRPDRPARRPRRIPRRT